MQLRRGRLGHRPLAALHQLFHFLLSRTGSQHHGFLPRFFSEQPRNLAARPEQQYPHACAAQARHLGNLAVTVTLCMSKP